MGKAVVSAKIENLEDVFAVRQGTLAPENVRKVEVPDALIDTSATGLMVPKRLIDQLGLVQFKTRSARTINGQATLGVFRGSRPISEAGIPEIGRNRLLNGHGCW